MVPLDSTIMTEMSMISIFVGRTCKMCKSFAANSSICFIVFAISLLCWRNIQIAVSSNVAKDVEHKMLTDIRKSFKIDGIKSACRNSVGGTQLISDDRGYVCSRHNLDPTSSCCLPLITMHKSTQDDSSLSKEHNKNPSSTSVKGNQHIVLSRQFECSSCIIPDGCCHQYEYCISCCLKPENLQKHLNLYLSIPVLQQKVSTSSAIHRDRPDYFDYCKHVCRTNSLSVQTENTYRGFHNHCYSQKKSTLERIPANSDWTGYFRPKK